MKRILMLVAFFVIGFVIVFLPGYFFILSPGGDAVEQPMNSNMDPISGGDVVEMPSDTPPPVQQ